jgi:hypothetical protein
MSAVLAPVKAALLTLRGLTCAYNVLLCTEQIAHSAVTEGRSRLLTQHMVTKKVQLR